MTSHESRRTPAAVNLLKTGGYLKWDSNSSNRDFPRKKNEKSRWAGHSKDGGNHECHSRYLWSRSGNKQCRTGRLLRPGQLHARTAILKGHVSSPKIKRMLLFRRSANAQGSYWTILIHVYGHSLWKRWVFYVYDSIKIFDSVDDFPMLCFPIFIWWKLIVSSCVRMKGCHGYSEAVAS